MTRQSNAEDGLGLPRDHEAFGVVLDISLPEQGHPDLDAPVERHACRVADGTPLCGAAVPEDAPVYPFRGQRSQIAAGLSDVCPECRARLAELAESEAATEAETA